MNRQLFLMVIKKVKALMIVILLVMGIAGSFTQYCLFSAHAAQEKWDFCTRFTGDWYCYISSVPYGESDELKDRIHNEYTSYMIKSVNTGVDYSAYQYSEDAWNLFQYPLKEGNGFSKEKANEVVVSKGMSHKYPLGSKIEVDLYVDAGREGETLECEVVGVLEREEIIFPNRFLAVNYTLWNEQDSFNSLTLEKMFLILSPQLELNNKNTYNESPGVFFEKKSGDDLELFQKLNENGNLISLQKVYEDSEEEREISRREYGISILFWMVVLLCLIILDFVVIKKCEEDIFYLLYIGFSKKRVLKWICQMNVVLVFGAYILSFIGYYLPTELEVYWKMNREALIVSLLIYLLICFFGNGIIFLKYQNYKYESEKRVFCIENMTLLDNVQLYLLANGYSKKSIKTVAYSVLQEKELSFCAKRKMWNLNVEQLNSFEMIVAKMDGK